MPATAHLDTFVLDNLPDAAAMPDLINLDALNYPEQLNAAYELVDAHVLAGRGDRIAIRAPGLTWTYAELAKIINQMANLLVSKLGMQTGNRVLLRSANNPTMVALYLATIKAGGIVVATMPLLRARELLKIIDKAETRFAFCDAGLIDEMNYAVQQTPHVEKLISWDGHVGGELGAMLATMPDEFAAVATRHDDPCLLGFTSGTTGLPKATIHFHRDLLIVCDLYARHVLEANEDDVFIGSPPLAFTFGLGGMVLFPFRIGASTALPARTGPDDLARAIADYGATVIFTAPTSYRAMLGKIADYNLSSLRKCVSAGEALPLPTFEAWKAATGITLLDGIGATEMLHIFIAAKESDVKPGSTGRPVYGYEARVVDEAGNPCPAGVPGRLAVRGPLGCKYLADERQAKYVENGWNMTGDTYTMDADGYFHYQARSDDMIISAGYNIAGPEVENSLLSHAAVKECGVVGAPDAERGFVVKAYIVLNAGFSGSDELKTVLQNYVKSDLAPYKYPRAIEWVDTLPKTESGKLQRSVLRRMAEGKV